jgi:MFS transporter, DHA2 family, multidrug resistance protein
MVPVVGMALKDMPENELRDASGFNNLTRNLGGAVGIAAVNTWLIDFSGQHGARILEALGQGGGAGALGGLARRIGAAGIGPVRGGQVAGRTILDAVSAQALTLAFDDVFRLSAWIFLACLLVVPFCRGGPMTQGARRSIGH